MALFGQVLRNADNDYKSRNNVLISGSAKIIFFWFWKRGWKFHDNTILTVLHKKSSERNLGTLFYKKYTNTLHNNDQRGKRTILVLFKFNLVLFYRGSSYKVYS